MRYLSANYIMEKVIVIILIAAIAAACGGPGNKASENGGVVDQTPPPSVHSASFNGTYGKLLVSYYALKDALVEYDTMKANAAAQALAGNTASLPTDTNVNDTANTAKQTVEGHLAAIRTAAAGFSAEPDLEQKKRKFQTISDALYNLVRLVKYDGQKVYRQHCPMAFKDEEEAYWLSSSNTVVNPYLGKKHPKYKSGMAGCGDVADSLGYNR